MCKIYLQRKNYMLYLLKLFEKYIKFSGDDDLKGNTRSHSEHGSQAFKCRRYLWVTLLRK